jgi:hypothetical protein
MESRTGFPGQKSEALTSFRYSVLRGKGPGDGSRGTFLFSVGISFPFPPRKGLGERSREAFFFSFLSPDDGGDGAKRQRGSSSAGRNGRALGVLFSFQSSRSLIFASAQFQCTVQVIAHLSRRNSRRISGLRRSRMTQVRIHQTAAGAHQQPRRFG